MDRDADERGQRSILPRSVEVCPRCGERSCGRFGQVKVPWLYCYSCLISGSKGWVYNSNSRGMQTQLSIRKYLQQARTSYLTHGFPDSVSRTRYGIPEMRWDTSNASLFDAILLRGTKGGLAKVAAENHGHCRVDQRVPSKTDWPLLPIELYPGMVCGVCYLLPDGPVNVYLSTIRRNEASPVVIIRMPRNFTKLVRVSGGIEQAFSVAKEYAVFDLPVCVVADLA
jgi:hypothetical protein